MRKYQLQQVGLFSQYRHREKELKVGWQKKEIYLWVITFLFALSLSVTPTCNTDQACPQILDLGSESQALKALYVQVFLVL